MSSHEGILKLIYHDHKELSAKYPSESGFVNHYLGSESKTHVVIACSIDLNFGQDLHDRCVLTNEEYLWFQRHNPHVDFGQLDGKGTNIWAEFDQYEVISRLRVDVVTAPMSPYLMQAKEEHDWEDVGCDQVDDECPECRADHMRECPHCSPPESSKRKRPVPSSDGPPRNKHRS
jgi:hypothetical protein